MSGLVALDPTVLAIVASTIGISSDKILGYLNGGEHSVLRTLFGWDPQSNEESEAREVIKVYNAVKRISDIKKLIDQGSVDPGGSTAREWLVNSERDIARAQYEREFYRATRRVPGYFVPTPGRSFKQGNDYDFMSSPLTANFERWLKERSGRGHGDSDNDFINDAWTRYKSMFPGAPDPNAPKPPVTPPGGEIKIPLNPDDGGEVKRPGLPGEGDVKRPGPPSGTRPPDYPVNDPISEFERERDTLLREMKRDNELGRRAAEERYDRLAWSAQNSAEELSRVERIGIMEAVNETYYDWLNAGPSGGRWEDWLRSRWNWNRVSGGYRVEDFTSPYGDWLIPMYPGETKDDFERRLREFIANHPSATEPSDEESKARRLVFIEEERRREQEAEDIYQKYKDEFKRIMLGEEQTPSNGPPSERMADPDRAIRKVLPGGSRGNGRVIPPTRQPGESDSSFQNRMRDFIRRYYFEDPLPGETYEQYESRMSMLIPTGGSIRDYFKKNPGESDRDWEARRDAFVRYRHSQYIPPRPPGMSDADYRRLLYVWVRNQRTWSGGDASPRLPGESEEDYQWRLRAWRDMLRDEIPPRDTPIDDTKKPPTITPFPGMKWGPGDEGKGPGNPGDGAGSGGAYVPPDDNTPPTPPVERPRIPEMVRRLGEPSSVISNEFVYNGSMHNPVGRGELIPYVNKYPWGHSEREHWGRGLRYANRKRKFLER